jgi:hypothetical protein
VQRSRREYIADTRIPESHFLALLAINADGAAAEALRLPFESFHGYVTGLVSLRPPHPAEKFGRVERQPQPRQ